MADYYRPEEVQQLLRYRKVLFIGDSNVLPLYKDLVVALTHKRLIRVENLRNPNVESFCGDIALQQCGKRSSWSYWENRLFEKGGCRVEMLFTGTVQVDVVREFIRNLREVPSAIPHIVYTSFSTVQSKNRQHHLHILLNDFKSIFPCSTFIVVGSGFVTVKDSFGDPLFDDIPYFSMYNSKKDENGNDPTSGRALFLGFHFLNFAFYIKNNVFRGMTVRRGWESVIVRYMTSLLLTCIAQHLMIKTPGRVNQEVMTKAISSTHENAEVYRALLLKQATDWTSARAPVLADPSVDSAENALEILKFAWRDVRGIGKSRGRTACSSSEDSVSDQQLSSSAVAREDDKWEEESLEEGEIREPTEEESQQHSPGRLVIDVSSSSEDFVSSGGEELEEVTVLPSRGEPLEYPTIVLSDDETASESDGNQLVTFTAQDSAIIKLASDDSVISSSSESAMVSSPSSLPLSTAPVASEGVTLKMVNGKVILWPSHVAEAGAELLWKWWRAFIQSNDNSLVLQHADIFELHARIPSPIESESIFQYYGGPTLAVPKIIDDLLSFFRVLKATSFDDNCFVDLKIRTEEDRGGQIAVVSGKPLPLSEELTRGSVKIVNFEISQKRTPWSPPNDAHISVRSFASYRATRIGPAASGVKRTASKAPFHQVAGKLPTRAHKPSPTQSPFSLWVPPTPMKQNKIRDCTDGRPLGLADEPSGPSTSKRSPQLGQRGGKRRRSQSTEGESAHRRITRSAHKFSKPSTKS